MLRKEQRTVQICDASASLLLCVVLPHQKGITELEKGQEKATRMIKSMSWIMACEQLGWLGHCSLDRT